MSYMIHLFGCYVVIRSAMIYIFVALPENGLLIYTLPHTPIITNPLLLAMAPISGVGTDPHIELSQAAQCGDYSTLDTILSFGKVSLLVYRFYLDNQYDRQKTSI